MAGAINATGLASGTVVSGKFLGLNSSNQVVLGSGGGGGATALSALTSATGSNSIDNAGNGQTWSWNSLSSGTALTISSTSMTSGTLLSLQDAAAAATSTGKVLSISDVTTGTGYGVYSGMTGPSNTGYAGYFTNTATGGANYAVYALNASTSGYAIYCNATYLNGCGGTQAWFSSSDGRLKDQIETLPAERGLGAIAKLRPVTYHWKDKKLINDGCSALSPRRLSRFIRRRLGWGQTG